MLRAAENVKLFQNSGVYAAYAARLAVLTRSATSFAEARAAFLADRFGACHFLAPVLEGDPLAFFTNGDDASLQARWAREQGMPGATSLADILLAQIEHHRTEVFYNLDPVRYGAPFLRRLPAHVRVRIAWRAAPSGGTDLSGYDLLVCNFPSILAGYSRQGWAAAWLAPAHDPVMDQYGDGERPVDVVFVGGYPRHHQRRAAVLEAVAARMSHRRVVLHLDRSRLTRLAETPLGRLLPLNRHRRPASIRAHSVDPVFGRELYAVLGNAKVVLNGAVDMAGEDRGNMRCFEALGCGAALVSDGGRYPPGLVAGETLMVYDTPEQAVERIEALLLDEPMRSRLATAGHAMVRQRYAKRAQWERFVQLVGGERADPLEVAG